MTLEKLREKLEEYHGKRLDALAVECDLSSQALRRIMAGGGTCACKIRTISRAMEKVKP